MFIGRSILDSISEDTRELLRNKLRELEAELHRPIQIVAGRQARPRPVNWRANRIVDFHDRVDASYTEQQAIENGIVFHDWAAPISADAHWYQATGVHTIRPEFVLDDADSQVVLNNTYFETQTFIENSNLTGLYWDEGEQHAFADIGDRVIAGIFSLSFLSQNFSHQIDLGALVEKAIRLSVDAEFQSNIQERKRAFDVEQFTRFHRMQSERRLENVRNLVVDYERALQQQQDQLGATIARLRHYREEAEILEARGTLDIDAVVADWERLLSHPRITNVRFRNSGLLEIMTDEITLHHPTDGPVALMGRFQISVNLENTTNVPVFENLDSPRGGREHPHVPDGGRPCFGQMTNSIMRVIQDGEYMAMFEYCLEFLESYNPRDDWGRYAVRWIEDPYVSEPEDTEGADPTTDTTTVEV